MRSKSLDGISDELKDMAKKTREDGCFTLKLDGGMSLALVTEFAKDMFPGVPLEDIAVWPEDEGDLVVYIRSALTLN